LPTVEPPTRRIVPQSSSARCNWPRRARPRSRPCRTTTSGCRSSRRVKGWRRLKTVKLYVLDGIVSPVHKRSGLGKWICTMIVSLSTVICAGTYKMSCWLVLRCRNSSAHNSDGPRAVTLNDSRHANMKELRFDAADGVLARGLCIRPEPKAISAGGRRQVGRRPKRNTLTPSRCSKSTRFLVDEGAVERFEIRERL
jgi:hypothetical protein